MISVEAPDGWLAGGMVSSARVWRQSIHATVIFGAELATRQERAPVSIWRVLTCRRTAGRVVGTA